MLITVSQLKNLINEKIRSPSGFNLNFFKKQDARDQRLYLYDNLTMLGEGSSRAVYSLTSKKVLKMSKSPAGNAQNEQEVNIYTDPKIKPIVAKIYDFDHVNYRWLISEITNPFQDSRRGDVELLIKLGIAHIMPLWEFVEKSNLEYYNDIDSIGDKRLSDTARALHTLIELGAAPGDLEKPSSWGQTADGRLVVIDYGLNEEIYHQFY